MIEDNKKARLVWQCRRGMLELDLILHDFLVKGLDLLSAEQLAIFERMLTTNDPTLLAWLMGQAFPIDAEFRQLVTYIRNTP